MIAAALGGLTMIYYMIRGNPRIMNIINSSLPLSGFFYAFFIIPVFSLQVTRFLYNHFRHTPRVVYFILAAEILL